MIVYINRTEQVLVIILSIALATFLVLGIIALVWLIRVLKGLKRITDRAEEMSEAIENSVKSFTTFKFLNNITDLVQGIRGKKTRR